MLNFINALKLINYTLLFLGLTFIALAPFCYENNVILLFLLLPLTFIIVGFLSIFIEEKLNEHQAQALTINKVLKSPLRVKRKCCIFNF